MSAMDDERTAATTAHQDLCARHTATGGYAPAGGAPAETSAPAGGVPAEASVPERGMAAEAYVRHGGVPAGTSAPERGMAAEAYAPHGGVPAGSYAPHGGVPAETYVPHEGAHCDELLADCRLRAATELLAHTWDPVVLAGLRPGARRRRDLLAAIGGVSDKALTETLRRLLANGLIARRRRPAAPPHVEYALTPLGTSLVDGPMRALAAWTLTHGDALLTAQEAAADGEPGSPPRGR